MNILILDDDKFRHEYFAKKYLGDKIFHAYKYSEFLNFLNQDVVFDLIHLDHDLDHLVSDCDTFLDGCGNVQFFNGTHAALKICELSDDMLPKKVIIQSVNPAGAKNMMSDLKARGVPVIHQPFGASFVGVL